MDRIAPSAQWRDPTAATLALRALYAVATDTVAAFTGSANHPDRVRLVQLSDGVVMADAGGLYPAQLPSGEWTLSEDPSGNGVLVPIGGAVWAETNPVTLRAAASPLRLYVYP